MSKATKYLLAPRGEGELAELWRENPRAVLLEAWRDISKLEQQILEADGEETVRTQRLSVEFLEAIKEAKSERMLTVGDLASHAGFPHMTALSPLLNGHSFKMTPLIHSRVVALAKAVDFDGPLYAKV